MSLRMLFTRQTGAVRSNVSFTNCQIVLRINSLDDARYVQSLTIIDFIVTRPVLQLYRGAFNCKFTFISISTSGEARKMQRRPTRNNQINKPFVSGGVVTNFTGAAPNKNVPQVQAAGAVKADPIIATSNTVS